MHKGMLDICMPQLGGYIIEYALYSGSVGIANLKIDHGSDPICGWKN